MPQLTKKSINNINTLLNECNKIKTIHYAEEAEEASPDVACIAIPLQSASGKGIAAISVSYPMYRFTPSKRDLIIKTLLKSKKHLDSLITDLNIQDLYS